VPPVGRRDCLDLQALGDGHDRRIHEADLGISAMMV
jgi:hypothetical protein